MVESPGAGNSTETGSKLKSQGSTRRARERELERRRAKGEISCAECRRLKLRCNKKIPCASCIRRGCHMLCPNGLLTTGQGSRFVLANTDKLHGKLLQMSQRIRQLEDALQIAHSSISKIAHPLLSEELLSIKSGVDGFYDEVSKKDEEDADEEEIAAELGTLSISEIGETRFVGRVGVETLLMNEQAEDSNDPSPAMATSYSAVHNQLPELLVDAAKDFPFQYRHVPKEELLKLVFEHLPTYERATALIEAFLENTSWLPRPIERDQIMESLLPLLYKAKYSNSASSLDEDGKYTGITKMHNLALALAVFSCGAASDLTQMPNNEEGKLYHVLSMAALNAHSVVGPGGASLETVQAIALIAQYHFYSGDQTTLEAAWKIISFALIIASSIGLHRDPAHWNMDPKYIQRRRFVFWEILGLDKWKSLGTGRPACFHMQEVDCDFPDDKEQFVDDTGKLHESPNRWRHRLVKQIIGPLSEHFLLTKPIKYSEIIDWDRKLREFDDPPVFATSAMDGTAGDVKRRMWAMNKEIIIHNIHRNFFARAMLKYPDNPLRSPFAPSFLAAYSSSIKLLRNMRVCYDLNPGGVLRIWQLWTHCLTSSVIVGSVASNMAQPQLARAAFQDLDLAIRLFEEAQLHPVSRRGLPILLRIRERAQSALQNWSQQAAVPAGVIVPKVEQDETDELAALHGTTRLLHGRRPHKSSSSPSRWCSIDGNLTPKSSASGDTSSPSPVLVTKSDRAARNSVAGLEGIPFASPTTDTPASSSSTSTVPSQGQLRYQPTSEPMTQDIASFFDTLYSTSSNSSNAAPLNTSPEFNNPGQQPQSFNQQLPHYVFGAVDPQAMGPINAGPCSVFSSDSWVDEAAQLDSMLSMTYSDFDGNPDTAQSINTTTTPPYDFSWLSAEVQGDHSQFSGDTAQFMEDWRFQAAMEGSHFLTDLDADSNMKY